MSEARVLAVVIVKDVTEAAQDLVEKVQLSYSPLGVSKAQSDRHRFPLAPRGCRLCSRRVTVSVT